MCKMNKIAIYRNIIIIIKKFKTLSRLLYLFKIWYKHQNNTKICEFSTYIFCRAKLNFLSSKSL